MVAATTFHSASEPSRPRKRFRIQNRRGYEGSVLLDDTSGAEWEDDRLRACERRLFTDIAKIVTALTFVHMFVETPLHELGHLLAASAYGLPARVEAGDTIVTTNSATVPPLVYLSGGLLAGCSLLLLSFAIKNPYRRGILPLVAAEFAYAPFDSTTLGYAVGLASLFVVLAGIMPMYVLRFMRAKVPQPDPQRSIRSARFVRCLAEYNRWLDGRPSFPGKGVEPRSRPSRSSS